MSESLLSRSSCPLWSLHLDDCRYLLEDDFIELLEHTPELGELNMGTADCGLSTNAMSRLTYREAPFLVPRLRRLEICRSDRFDDWAFVEMIESQWQLGSSDAETESTISQNQVVKLHRADEFDRMALTRCRQLLTEALDLQLISKRGRPILR